MFINVFRMKFHHIQESSEGKQTLQEETKIFLVISLYSQIFQMWLYANIEKKLIINASRVNKNTENL